MVHNAGVEFSQVGVWGAGTWSSTLKWGMRDSQRDNPEPSEMYSTGTWGRHCWVTDHWLRW